MSGVKVDKNDLIEAAEKRLHEPLRSTVANSLEDGIIPAFESVTGQVVQQISDPIARLPSSFPDNIAQLVDLTSKMASMTKAMENMQSQIEILFSATARNPGLTSNSDSSKLAVADNAGSVAPMQQQQQQQQQTMDEPHDSEDELEAIQEDEPEAIRGEEKLEAIRNKISQLLQECRYEDAYTYALSAYSGPTADMSVFCCSEANIDVVLKGSEPALNQPILMFLMEQLSMALLSSCSVDSTVLNLLG